LQRLSGLDAGFLYMETATLHMHTLKLAVLDPAPGTPLDFEEVSEAIRLRLPALPSFRRRLVEVPFGFHHPVWIEDPDFDLTNHLVRVRLPSPGDRHDLENAIADLAGVPLDRSRPLWQMYVFEGSADGRLAVCVKIHHAVADGAAAAALLANVMSPIEVPGDEPLPDDWEPEPLPSSLRLLFDAIADHLGQLRLFPALVGRTAKRSWSVAVRRRRSSITTPFPILNTPRTSFNTSITARRSFGMTTLPLDAAREVKRRCGVSLNDVVLAVVGSALRSYLLERKRLPDRALVAGVPISSDPDRTDGGGSSAASMHRLEGNRVANLFTTLATDQPDPVRRLLTIQAVTSEAKAIQQTLGTRMLADWVQYTPPRPYAWFMRLYSRRRLADRHPPAINVVVSNVPGPSAALFVAGARLRELYSVGPVLEGVGLNVTVWSYLDRLFVSALACRDSLPDLHAVIDRIPAELDDLVTATRSRPVVRSRR
jgi:diacylglycerol O-acyltransferase / wax synthase